MIPLFVGAASAASFCDLRTKWEELAAKAAPTKSACCAGPSSNKKAPHWRGFSITPKRDAYLVAVFFATTFFAGALAAVLVAVFFTAGAA